MSQELPPAPPVGKTRVQVLQERIDLLAGKITAASDEIISIGKEIRGLDDEKDAAKIKRLETQQTKLEATRISLEEQQAKAEADLAKLEDKIEFAGKDEVIALIGPELNTLPSLEELKDHLNTRPPANFPLPADVFLKLKNQLGGVQQDPNVVLFFEKSCKCFPSENIYSGWLIRNFTHDVLGKSENDVLAAITPAIGHVLEYFLREAGVVPEVARNQTETTKRLKTTSGTTRPDFLLHIKNLLVFRGEEKKDGGSLFEAANELTSKMEVWNPLFFGDIPYVIGYALAGAEFQLYALHPDLSKECNAEGVPVLSTAISDLLNLNLATGRALLIQHMVNLVRVLQALVEMAPKGAPKFEGAYKRPRPYSGEFSTLHFKTTYVEKELAEAPGLEQFDFDELQELYRLVQQGEVVNTIQCKPKYPKLANDRAGIRLMTLHLYPLGRCVLPDNKASLQLCLLTVLGALESMHANQFVHRDVRWPNILRLANNTWMLIDLEFARKVDEKSGVAPWPFWLKKYVENGVVWPPRNGVDESWGKAKDVWMVGQLLEDMNDCPIDGVDFDALATEIKNCQNCAEAKAVVSRVLLV